MAVDYKTAKHACNVIKRKTFCNNTRKIEGRIISERPSIIYDFEGGLYPADIMALAVLLNSD